MIAYLPHMEVDQILSNLESTDTTHINKLGLEYKSSSDNPKDFALMLCDDGGWVKSLYLNEDLNSGGFFDVQQHLKMKKEEA